MPALLDSRASEVARNPSPARGAGRARPLSISTSQEPNSNAVRSAPSPSTFGGYATRKQSPARSRPISSRVLVQEDSWQEGSVLGFKVEEGPGLGFRVQEASKPMSNLRARSPHPAARIQQSTGSPYLAKVYDVPSQRSASTKGRSVSRERAARMSMGKVDGLDRPRRTSKVIAASEPTSPTAPLSSSSRRNMSLRKPAAEAGRGYSAYLDRLSGEAEQARVQTADPSASAKLSQSGSRGVAQDGFQDGGQSSIHQQFRKQREEGRRPAHTGLGSQRTDAFSAERNSVIGKADARPALASSGSARALLRKQSGLDALADISIKVEELLRVSKSHGRAMADAGLNPASDPRSSPTASTESLSARQPAPQASFLRKEEGVRDTWAYSPQPNADPDLFPSTSMERKLRQMSPQVSSFRGEESARDALSFEGFNSERDRTANPSRGSTPSTSAGTPLATPKSPQPTSARRGKESVNAHGVNGYGGERVWSVPSAERPLQVSVDGGEAVRGRNSMQQGHGAWGLGEGLRRSREEICTDAIVDEDDIQEGLGGSAPSACFEHRESNERRAVEKGTPREITAREESAYESIALSSGEESGSERASAGFSPRSEGHRSRAGVSSDDSRSPERMRSQDSFGSSSPDIDRFSICKRAVDTASLDFRIASNDSELRPEPFQNQSPPEKPMTKRKSAKIVPLFECAVARPAVGLRNLGNTCFLNSILQCLISTPPLAIALVTLQDPALQQAVDADNAPGVLSPGGSGKSRPRLAGPLVRLVRGMTEARPYSAVTPQEFLTRLERWAPQFADGDQHDSQEALRIIMEALDVDCSRVRAAPPYRELASTGAPPERLAGDAWSYHRSRHDSVIQDIFSGQLQSTVECLECGLQSHCFDPFLDLSLPLPKASKSGSWSSGRPVTLQQCLAAFTSKEELEEDHFCERCKAPRPATKKLGVFRLPRVLVLHIKRISGARFSLFSKDSTTVDFPLEGLDMQASLSEDADAATGVTPLYDLLAVSNHSGSLTGGHYTAYCKEMLSQGATWHCYNDSNVSEMSPSQVVTSSAYVLFYSRRLGGDV